MSMSRNETSYSSYQPSRELLWLCLCLAMRRLTAEGMSLIDVTAVSMSRNETSYSNGSPLIGFCKLCLCLAMRRLTASNRGSSLATSAVSMSRNETSYSDQVRLQEPT